MSTMTRDFASAVTIGYKQNHPSLTLSSGIQSAALWSRIIGEYANTMFPDTGVDFDPVDTVITAQMCASTGMIANSYCPKGSTGYWKSSYAPYCDGSHGGLLVGQNTAPQQQQQPEYGTGDTGTGTGGGTVDPGTGGGDTGWVDPGTGGGTVDPGTGGGDTGWVDPGTGGGDTGTGGGDAGTGGETW